MVDTEDIQTENRSGTNTRTTRQVSCIAVSGCVACLPRSLQEDPLGNGMWIEGRGEGACGTWILLLQVWMVTRRQNDSCVSYPSWPCDKMLDRSSVGEERFWLMVSEDFGISCQDLKRLIHGR